MNTFGNSISYGPSPLDQLVGETLTKHVDSFLSIPPISKFHLIQDGEHFLVLSRIEKVTTEFFEGGRTLIDRDLRIKNTKLPIWDPSNPEIAKLPILRLETESQSPLVQPEKAPSFVVGNRAVFLSREVQKGILGIRGENHSISLELLKRCMNRKRTFQKPRTGLYLWDKERNAVLNLVVLSCPERFTILTAYYPTNNALKYRLNNCSNTFFEAWKARLPRV